MIQRSGVKKLGREAVLERQLKSARAQRAKAVAQLDEIVGVMVDAGFLPDVDDARVWLSVKLRVIGAPAELERPPRCQAILLADGERRRCWHWSGHPGLHCSGWHDDAGEFHSKAWEPVP
jgi:hypothetical protein